MLIFKVFSYIIMMMILNIEAVGIQKLQVV
jgi:hypothetical protein